MGTKMRTKSSVIVGLGFGLLASISLAAPPTPKVIASTPPADDLPVVAPVDALKAFKIPDEFEMEVVLAEPEVRQPLFITWDERGRMWVVQYLQYPEPAGLKMVSRDEFWRAVYDKVPPAPPNHIQGLDKITIHEDTDGDGRFDKHKTFVEGLSIVSACEIGDGGVWVLNPPYLLFYPDKNRDDVPDGDPVVHLQGFGIEDTHSVANSLRWGPDGWLYGAQGSTVSGHISRPGDKKPIDSMGQVMWRYHPELLRYEIFAEGGGNAFSCEIDSEGRVFSGHNGGNTRGFHYVQGGYYQKGFAKHGPLSNPYAFGYFAAMTHHDVPRFSHNFLIDEGGALPAPFRGRLYGVEPLAARVVMSDVSNDKSSFKTKDVGFAVTTEDRRFRPVEIKTGPDGAIYIADMYEPRIAHREHFQGHIDKATGRIYRLKTRGTGPVAPFDLGNSDGAQLFKLLEHPNKWFVHQALRQFALRKDPSLWNELQNGLATKKGRLALQYLFALYLSGGLDEHGLMGALAHSEPVVREWGVRLACDVASPTGALAAKVIALAATEPDVRVRSQMAASARRMSPADSVAVIAVLLKRDEDADDIHIPLLLWWAVEAQSQRPELLALFDDLQFWKRPIVAKHILSRLMQKYATAGLRSDLDACARLLKNSPDMESTAQLMRGFEAAFKGRSLSGLPDELVDVLAKAGSASPSLGVRRGDRAAIENALATIADKSADATARTELIEVFGEVSVPACIPFILTALRESSDLNLQMAAITALQRYDDSRIGAEVVAAYPKFTEDARAAAETLLVSRNSWTKQMLDAIEGGVIDRTVVPPETVRKMTIHQDARIGELVSRLWPNLKGATSAELQEQIAKFQNILRSGDGDPFPGKAIFMKSCGKCHTLFGEGGRIGPDLTAYKRDDSLNILIHVVNPSAEIREGFETYLALTDDGRAVTGFLADRDKRVVVLRSADGQNIVLERTQIEEMRAQKTSLMPEGLLRELDEQQVRDLFAYLRSSQPLNVTR